MRQLDAYIARSVLMATFAVIMIIVGLDAIFAMVAEIEDFRNSYQFIEALQYIAMRLPRRVYEYMPMACLIGCLAGLGTLAASSELTVMRAAGISVARITLAVLKPTAVLMVLSLLNAEFAVPNLERMAESMKTVAQGKNLVDSNRGRGYWHREGNEYTRFAAADPNGVLFGVTTYTFDDERNLKHVRYAKRGEYKDVHWVLTDVNELHISDEKTVRSSSKEAFWKSELTPRTLNVVIYEPRDMSISDLYTYSQYLNKEGLNSDRYMLSFWSKVNQPIGTFALVILGISFIFGPLRSVTPGVRIFSGIMVGLVYKYAEELLAPTSILMGFPPLMATLVPTAICFVLGTIMLKRAG